MVEKLELFKTSELAKLEDGSWAKLGITAIATCPKIKKEREVKILADRFGLGKNPKTLNAIGIEYGLTRERIRQIVNNAVKKIQKYCVGSDLKKRISGIERVVNQNAGLVTGQSLANTLKITDAGEQNALFFIAGLSQKLVLIKESNFIKRSWSEKNVKLTKIKKISKESTDLLKSENKVMTTRTIAEKLKEDEKFTHSVLMATKAVMQTEDGQWGLEIWPHVNPKSIRDRSRFILRKYKKPMHYSELTKHIGEMSSKKVTKQSVHNELIKNIDFVLIGRGIYALSQWGYTPGVVEEVIVEVLKEAGEPLHKKEIIRRVKDKRIVQESTIVLNLQKKRFKRITKAVYTLG